MKSFKICSLEDDYILTIRGELYGDISVPISSQINTIKITILDSPGIDDYFIKRACACLKKVGEITTVSKIWFDSTCCNLFLEVPLEEEESGNFIVLTNHFFDKKEVKEAQIYIVKK